MVYVDARNPGALSLSDIEKMYTQTGTLTPQQVDSDMFLRSSRGREIVKKRFRELTAGKHGTPAEYFTKRMYEAQSQAVGLRMQQENEMLAARQAAIPQEQPTRSEWLNNPDATNILAAQRYGDRAPAYMAAVKAKQQQQSDAGIYRNSDYRALTHGAAPRTAADIRQLVSSPAFQQLLQTRPEAATKAFQQLTQRDLAETMQGYSNEEADSMKAATAMMRKYVTDNALTIGEDGVKIGERDPDSGKIAWITPEAPLKMALEKALGMDGRMTPRDPTALLGQVNPPEQRQVAVDANATQGNLWERADQTRNTLFNTVGEVGRGVRNFMSSPYRSLNELAGMAGLPNIKERIDPRKPWWLAGAGGMVGDETEEEKMRREQLKIARMRQLQLQRNPNLR